MILYTCTVRAPVQGYLVLDTDFGFVLLRENNSDSFILTQYNNYNNVDLFLNGDVKQLGNSWENHQVNISLLPDIAK